MPGKADFVARISDVFDRHDSFVVLRSHGMSVGSSTQLRLALMDSGARLMAMKNRLVRVALKDKPAVLCCLDGHLSGSIFIAYSNDIIALSRAICAFVGDKKNAGATDIMCGLCNDRVVDKVGVEHMATMLSADEMRASIVHALNYSTHSLVSHLRQNPLRLIRVLNMYVDQLNG